MEQCQEDGGSVRGEDDHMNYQIELIEPMVGESIIPDETEIRLDEAHESENDKNDEFLEEQPIELKIPESVADLENCEQFTCSMCNMTFTSIIEHVREYHDDQQIIIEASYFLFINRNPNILWFQVHLANFYLKANIS